MVAVGEASPPPLRFVEIYQMERIERSAEVSEAFLFSFHESVERHARVGALLPREHRGT